MLEWYRIMDDVIDESINENTCHEFARIYSITLCWNGIQFSFFVFADFVYDHLSFLLSCSRNFLSITLSSVCKFKKYEKCGFYNIVLLAYFCLYIVFLYNKINSDHACFYFQKCCNFLIWKTGKSSKKKNDSVPTGKEFVRCLFTEFEWNILTKNGFANEFIKTTLDRSTTKSELT